MNRKTNGRMGRFAGSVVSLLLAGLLAGSSLTVGAVSDSADKQVYIVGEASSSVLKAPDYIKLSREKATRGVGDSYQLTATLPAGTQSAIVWSSSNESVVSVDQTGKIMPLVPGKAVITATTQNGKSASCTVTVRKAPESVTLSREKATRGVGDSYQLTASIPAGTMTNYTWTSSDDKVVSVDKKGKIMPLAPGKAVITATSHNGVSASCTVTVRNAPESVTLNREKTTRAIGEKFKLTTQIPANTMTTYKWTSSSKSTASVDKNGNVTVKKTGKAVITVTTHNGKMASCTVTVKNAPSKITLSREKATRGVGDSYQLTAKLPSGSTGAIAWSSSNPGVVSVDKTGKIMPLVPGKAVITATTYNGKSASCTVTVRKAPESVSLNRTKATLGVGEKYQMKTTLPSGTMTNFTWISSDTGVVSVDKNGKLSAKKIGNAVVTATAHNGVKASCNVFIIAAPSQAKLSASSVTYGVGESGKLTFKKDADCFDRFYQVSTSNKKVADIKVSGNEITVSAKAVGSAKITLKTCNGLSNVCTVTVKKAPTSISISNSTMKIGAGEKITVSAIANSGAYANSLTWTSGNKKVATVKAKGNAKAEITGVATGTVTITAKSYNGKTASCKVTVIGPPTKVKISKSKLILDVNETFTVTASVDTEINDKTFTVSSSDKKVATASMLKDGKVRIKALKVGEATITVKTYNGLTAKLPLRVVSLYYGLSGTTIKQSILTKNPCYTANEKIEVKGLMLHSVGVNQQSALPFINIWNSPSYSRACVHGFIDGNTGTVYQTLPWDHRAWHSARVCNDTHIGVEMCEPSCITYTNGANFVCSDYNKARAVAKKTYDSAVNLFAYLCVKYDLDPLEKGVIISHYEGSLTGVASGHVDPEHLWKGLNLNYTMDKFRADVKKAIDKQFK